MNAVLRWTSLALFLCASAQALDTTGYRYCRNVATAGDREELAAITLDSALWDVLRDGAADLRVADANGRAVPYLLRKALNKDRRTERIACASRMEAFNPLPGNRAEIRLSLATNAPAAHGMVFETPLKDFERELSVWGVLPNGSEQLLVEDAPIYDYSRFADARHCTVPLPANEYRQFRVLVKAITDEAQSPRRQIERTLEGEAEVRRKDASVVTERPFRIDRVSFYHERATEGRQAERRAEYEVEGWTVREDDRRKQTVIEIETRHEPLTGFAVETEARNFSRPARVEAPVREGGIETWRSAGAGSLSRIAFRNLVREELELAVPEQRQRRWRIVIENQDGPPIGVTGMRGLGPVWQAVFFAEPGARYTVYAGGGETPPPVYDTAAIRRVLTHARDPLELALEAHMENPAFRRRGAGLGGRLGSRGFLVLGVVVMVGVLAFGLLRAARKIPKFE